MRYLIIQGSSHHEIFVYCSNCKEKHVWLKAYALPTIGVYIVLCAKCKRSLKCK